MMDIHIRPPTVLMDYLVQRETILDSASHEIHSLRRFSMCSEFTPSAVWRWRHSENMDHKIIGIRFAHLSKSRETARTLRKYDVFRLYGRYVTPDIVIPLVLTCSSRYCIIKSTDVGDRARRAHHCHPADAGSKEHVGSSLCSYWGS